MPRFICSILAVTAVFCIQLVCAQVDDEEDAYQTQVPAGMELQQIGKKTSVKAVLPKGTAVRREGDLRILEGSGEYAARKFVKYDVLLDKMNTDIASLREDVDKLKHTISKMQEKELSSK